MAPQFTHPSDIRDLLHLWDHRVIENFGVKWIQAPESWFHLFLKDMSLGKLLNVSKFPFLHL